MTTGEFRERDLSANLEVAFRPGGLIEQFAQSALEQPTELAPHEVADIIMPPRQPNEAYQARWQLVEGAPAAIKAAAEAHAEEVLALAETLNMRRPEALAESESLSRIVPEQAVWLVEGGANRTSVVRRSLAVEAMQKVYGDAAADHYLYQFGSDRPIPRERNGQPNAEYGVAQEIAGDFLPDEDSLTEFGLNLASARQAGYEIVGWSGMRIVKMQKAGSPQLILVQPNKVSGGLSDAFFELASRRQDLDSINFPQTGDLTGKQFVIATNGQYRPKDEAQADQWAAAQGIDTLPAVALGDEPGYRVSHAGREITTASRAPMAYVNESVVLHRLLAVEPEKQ